MTNYGNLPTELKREIMSYSSAKTLRSLRQVNKSTRDLLEDEIFWRNKTRRDFGKVTRLGTWINIHEVLSHDYYVPTVTKIYKDNSESPTYRSLGIYPTYKLAQEILIEEYLKYFLQNGDKVERNIQLFSDPESFTNPEYAPPEAVLVSLRDTLRSVRSKRLARPGSASQVTDGQELARHESAKTILGKTPIGQAYYEWLVDWLDTDLKHYELKIGVRQFRYKFFITGSQLKFRAPDGSKSVD